MKLLSIPLSYFSFPSSRRVLLLPCRWLLLFWFFAQPLCFPCSTFTAHSGSVGGVQRTFAIGREEGAWGELFENGDGEIWIGC